jgi:hypothetical protein
MENKTDKQYFRLEYKPAKKQFHLERIDSHIEPDTNGWVTICDEVEDRIATEFIYRMNERIHPKVCSRYYKSRISVSKIEKLFEEYIQWATSVDVIEITPVNDKTFRMPVVYQDKNGKCTPCPYCGERHTHGVGSGIRLPHCSNKLEDYKCFDKQGNAISVNAKYFVVANFLFPTR